jgi:hypothetical protein
MTVAGRFRDGYPRLTITLPGLSGSLLDVELIVDTGFDGELALPPHLAHRLDLQAQGQQTRMLADGSLIRCPLFSLVLPTDDSDDEADDAPPRVAELLVLDGNPLVGTQFVYNHLLQVEVTEGGEVLAEPL